jgi:hypothetical protein
VKSPRQIPGSRRVGCLWGRGANRPGCPIRLQVECIQSNPLMFPVLNPPSPSSQAQSHHALSSPSTPSATYNNCKVVHRKRRALSSLFFQQVKGECLSFIYCSPRLFLVYIVGRACEDWSETCLTIPIYVCVLTTV